MSKKLASPLSDTIITAIAQLVDDAQSARRDPSHSDIEYHINRTGLTAGDPVSQGQNVGKMKRIRAVLGWALEHNYDAGSTFVESFLNALRGLGSFRKESPNYSGEDAINNAIGAFASEGYLLSLNGELQPVLLENLSGTGLTEALQAYVRRAKRGSDDAALLTGTGKDLLEAVSAYILEQRYGGYSSTSNFPTLLGQVFITLGLATPQDPTLTNEPPNKRMERAMFELACSVNQMRNKQGTGHGRPWISTVTDGEARMAIESIGVIAERLLNLHLGIK